MGTKDMAITLAVVLVVVGLIALYGSRVSFAPGAQPTSGPIPSADAVGGFEHAKATMGFPITVPVGLPASWHPNSFSVSDPSVVSDGVSQVGSLPAARGGWLTPDGRFIELIETAGDVDRVLRNEFGAARSVEGSVRVGGVSWQVTRGVRAETAWVRSVGTAPELTTIVITGNASERDFRILAAAVAAAG